MAVVNGDGTITYTQNVFATGTVTFTYTVSDARGGTATATVTVTLAIPADVGIDMLRSQVADLDLDADEKAALTAKLDAAAHSLAEGHQSAAQAQLNAFLNQILAFNQSGRLDDPTRILFENQVDALQSVLV